MAGSIFSTRTLICWPSCSTSLGCFTRPQATWLTWTRPSMPPRSTKAPKSMSFRTTPSRTWPGWSESSSCCRACSALALQNGPAAEDQVSPIGIGLGDDARQPLIDERGEVLDAIQGDLADRDEAADVVDFAFQPAGVVAGHADLDQGPFDQVGPIVDLHRLVRQAQFVEAVFGVEPLDDHLHQIAGHGGRVELPQRDDALLAALELDEHVVAADGHHAAALHRVRLEELLFVLRSGAEQVVHRGPAHRPAQLVFQFGRRIVAHAGPR